MKTLIFILCILLILFNAGCCPEPNGDVVKDLASRLSYKEQQVYELEETRKQIMTMLPELARGAPKDEIIGIAKMTFNEELFEKDGCIWVDWVGLKFDENGRLIHVSPRWNYGQPDPCFP